MITWTPDWTRRDKTVLCLVPPTKYSEQSLLARTLIPSAVVVDWRSDFLHSTRPGQKRLGLTVESEIRRLTLLAESDRRVFFVINTEYLIAGLDRRSLDQFWRALKNSFPHPKGIVIFCALNTKGFVPSYLDEWRNGDRLIVVD